MNSRTHRKLLVIDGRLGFIGGVGIADQWSGHAQSPDHWRDSHFRLEGPAVAHLQAAFADNWMKTRADVFNSADYFPDIAPVGEVVHKFSKVPLVKAVTVPVSCSCCRSRQHGNAF